MLGAFGYTAPRHAPISFPCEKESTSVTAIHSSIRNKRQRTLPVRFLKQFLDFPVGSQRSHCGNVPRHYVRYDRSAELPGPVLAEEVVPLSPQPIRRGGWAAPSPAIGPPELPRSPGTFGSRDLVDHVFADSRRADLKLLGCKSAGLSGI